MDYSVTYHSNLLTDGTRFKISSDKQNLDKNLTVLIVSKRVYLHEVFSSALRGNTDEIGRLASIYFRGYGIKPNRDFAITILEEFISNSSQFSLAHNFGLASYYDETGRFELAVQLYRKLVEKDHGMAMTKLGKMYLAGKGVSKDFIKGERLLKSGSQTGNVTSRGMYGKHLIEQGSIFKKLKGLTITLFNIVPVIKYMKLEKYDGLV